ncbi:MAG: TlpA family protein disulfide reductase [Acidimicrobiia bacterium]
MIGDREMAATRTRSKQRRLVGIGVVAALVIAGLLVISLVSSGTAGRDPSVARTGPPAPGLSFEMFDGSTATLADYQGRPLVVNFWASWCPSCVAEMSAAFRPVQQRLGDEVAFLGMNIQDRRGPALELVEETGVLFDLAEDPDGELYVELGGLGMPFTVFISEDGEVLEKHNGPLTEGQLEDMISEVLLAA